MQKSSNLDKDAELTTTGRVKLVAWDIGGNSTDAITDPFAIIDGTPPEITIISPNGGEVWDLGSQHEIVWEASSANTIEMLEILLYFGEYSHAITYDTENDGTYTWTLPLQSNYVTENAKIKITAWDSNGNESEDWSNDFFSINFYLARLQFLIVYRLDYIWKCIRVNIAIIDDRSLDIFIFYCCMFQDLFI